MLIGLTQETRDAGRERLHKAVKLILACFCIACLLLPAAWLLFRFNILASAPVFSADIQQPVAKVQTAEATGTAFLVSPTKLLTARHVLKGLKEGDKVQLAFERLPEPRTVQATILYIAPQQKGLTDDSGRVSVGYFLDDVAVLQIPEVQDIVPLDAGASDAVTVLDDVVLIGYPNGDYSITKGSINSDKYQDLDLFKLDAASNPGNSGGPCILKEDNTVIGMLVGGQRGTQGENIAIKMNTIKELLRKKGIDCTK